MLQQLSPTGVNVPSYPSATGIEMWPIERLVPYVRNPRKNDASVNQMAGSIREFGFKIPCLVRSSGEVVDGHLRLKAAKQLGIAEVPVILCDEWSPAQVKAFRLMVGFDSFAGLTRDAAGDLYGTTSEGGASGQGAVYKIDASGRETVLHSFSGSDGSNPEAGVTRDAAGDLYGTTYFGGASGFGTVYKIDPSGQETVLHSFTGGDGSYPKAGVVRDPAGNLYGTTSEGGASGFGTVYKIDASGQETLLYSFTAGADGASPGAAVIRDAAGNLYGTTEDGGTSGIGTVYKLDALGHETLLHSFSGSDGQNPYAGVVRDADGDLYGTTAYGGASDAGTVYKIDASGQETVLHSFTGLTDGGYPYAGLIRDAAGNLYGTTFAGGAGLSGIVYEINPTGLETVLYSFQNFYLGAPSGAFPSADLTEDGSGNLFGTTTGGGTTGGGVVFELVPNP